MRSLFAALALTGCSMSVYSQTVGNVGMTDQSQQNMSPLILGRPEQIAYKEYKPPGLRMRNTGTILTVIGGAMMVGGLIVYNNKGNEYSSYSGGTYYYVENENEIYGQALFGVGMGMAVPGIICWTKGAKKYKRHLERETALRIGARGLSLSYRF